MSRQLVANVVAARVAQLEQAAWLDVMEESLPEIDAYFVEQAANDKANAALEAARRKPLYEDPLDEALRDALKSYTTTIASQQAKSAYERDREALMKVFERELAEMRLRQMAKRAEPDPITRAIDLG